MALPSAEGTIQGLIGENVRRLREERGWTQHQLSVVSGLHVSYISGIECGRRNITASIIERLAASLKAHPGELFKDG
jgi:transcriptional regulator with XRE-family HTH domain